MMLVLGYFGNRTNKLDGQTVKTRDVYRLAKEQYGDCVEYFDTEEFKFGKTSVFRMLIKVMRCKDLIYLPAHGNLKYLFPILFCLSVVCRFKVHYVVIGGWLREYLASLPLHRCMLSRVSGIHVETKKLKEELEGYYKFRNVNILPNFRFFDFVPKYSVSHKLRMVFMARINKMKGLDWLFYLADYIVSNGLEDKFSLTFYGQVNKDDERYFVSNVAKYSFVEYKGALLPSDIYDNLSRYDVLLLPTHFYTEGLPGSVVDAYIAGIPVIVTAWKYAEEFVDDGVSGFVIPFEDGQDDLVSRVLLLESNRHILKQMKENVLVKRGDFSPPLLPF